MATQTFTWIAADGSFTDLSSLYPGGVVEGIGVLEGVQGLEMPPYVLVTDEVPRQPGARLRQVKVLPRTVDLPLFIQAATPTLLRNLLRRLRYAFDPTRGDGTLRVLGVDSSTRDLTTCRYQGDWTGVESSQVVGGSSWEVPITLLARDPYWYDTVPQTVLFAIGTAGTPFFPFFPLHLSSSTVLGDVSVSNPGDVEAWPVWTITGPGSSIILRNLSVIPQAVLEVDTTLLAGDQLVIDTRPGHKTVIGPGGVNLYGALNASSQLWSLPVGTSTVRVEVTGATVDSLVRLEYTLRLLGI